VAAGKTITIAGGGLAGLALGIGLRRQQVPVVIWEAGNYPRHRVCGEFISGRGPAVLAELGLRQPCLDAGAIEAHTVLFVRGQHRSPVRRLDSPALCLSRHVLDALLAKIFQNLGGELRLNSRFPPAGPQPGVVEAAGRPRQPADAGPRWFGVKAHVTGAPTVPLAADLEVHLSAAGYVGVNRIGGGEVNVCGLLQARPGRRTGSKLDWLRGEAGSLLQARLRTAAFDPASFCSVAGLPLARRRAVNPAVCRVGDAWAMTPPVTGNGMSMAFEGAALAAGPLAAYSAGRLDWTAARQAIARRCDTAFARRLAWAGWLQWLMVSPLFRGPAGSILLRSEPLWRLLFTRTR